MGSPTSAIDKYIRDVIRLSQTDISSAVRSREWFLDRIKAQIESKYSQPILYKDEPFVNFGSYFKQTKVSTVDEFDILVVIDSNSGFFTRGGIQIGSGMGYADPNHKYDSAYLKDDGTGVSPVKLLNWLKRIVTEVTDAYGGEAPIRNGQAITATIKSKDLKIDLVPAGKFYNPQIRDFFYDIPRGDADGGWIVTNPKQDIALLDNAANGRPNFRNIIRVIKRIRNRYNMGVSSFAIETAVIEYCQANKWYDSLYLDLEYSIQYIAGCFKSGCIKDSYDNAVNLVDGVASLSWYADRLLNIVAVLDDCMLHIDDQSIIYDKVYKAFENL
jgi:hypothetical protein